MCFVFSKSYWLSQILKSCFGPWALDLGGIFLGLGRPGPDAAFLAQGPGDSQVLFLSMLTGGQAETPSPEIPNLHGCSFCENLLFRDSGIIEFGGPGGPRDSRNHS